MYQPRPWFLAAFLVYTVAIRLVPYVLYHFGLNIDPETTTYPWNFSPFYALCLSGAAHFAHRRWAYVVPLGAQVLGDLGIWALTGRFDWAFYPDQFFVYAAIGLMISSGLILRRYRSFPALGAVGLGSAVMFFLVTNFGVWLMQSTGRYTPDLAGLIECYVMAIPFFRNTLISVAVFSAILFSPIALRSREPAWEPALAAE